MLRLKEGSGGNRGKLDIIAEILRKLREPACKTNIMSRCNMSTLQSGQYLTLMKSSHLIQTDATARNVTYQRTEAGREFLTLYNQMVVLLEPNIPAPSLF
jgi:predicted transcriptional regulator